MPLSQEDKIIKELASKYYDKRDYKKAWLYFNELRDNELLEDRQYNSYLTCCKRLHKANTKELFEEAIAKFPLDLHIKRNYIDYLIQLKEFSKAEELVTGILDEWPDDFYAIDLKAKIYSQSNRIDLAIQTMEKKLESPKFSMGRNIHGENYELGKTFNAFFGVVAWHLDRNKLKERLLELIIKDGRHIDNLNLIFEQIELDESLSSLKTEYNISSEIFSALEIYEKLFSKLDNVVKDFQKRNVGKQHLQEKINFLNDTFTFLKRVKNFLIKLYDPEKRSLLIEKYKQKSVFISYSRIDSEFALKLRDELINTGFLVIMDEFSLEVNDYLQSQLRKLVRDSDYLVSVVSKNSLISEWVGAESIEVLMNERYKNESKKFISVVVDKRVFQLEFYIEIVEEVQGKIDYLLKLTVKVAGDLKASSFVYDISRERLFDLKSNLGKIWIRVKEYLSIDFTDQTKFRANINRLTDYINKPKPKLELTDER